MSPKNKALPLAMLLLIFYGAPIGCSSQLGGKSDSQVVEAEDGGEEEVLYSGDEDLDEFGRPKSDGASGEGGFVVAVTYLAMMAGSALLPFLLLL